MVKGLIASKKSGYSVCTPFVQRFMPSKTVSTLHQKKYSYLLFCVLVTLFGMQFWQIYALHVQVDRLSRPEGVLPLDEEDVPAEETVSTQLFTLLDSLAQAEEHEAQFRLNKEALDNFFKDPMWSKAGLQISPQSTFTENFVSKINTAQGVEVFEVALDAEGSFGVQTYFGPLVLEDALSAEKVFTQLKAFVEGELPKVLTQIDTVNGARGTLQNTVLNQIDLQNWMKSIGCYFGEEELDVGLYRRKMFNADGAVIAQVLLYKEDARIELKVAEEIFPLVDVNAATLLSSLQSHVDTKTALQKKVEALRQEIDGLLEDRGFVSTLNRLQFSMGPALETETRIEYPLKNAAGETLRIIFIDRADATVKVERAGESQTLSFALEEMKDGGKKKTLYSLPISRLMLV